MQSGKVDKRDSLREEVLTFQVYGQCILSLIEKSQQTRCVPALGWIPYSLSRWRAFSDWATLGASAGHFYAPQADS
jgi:hypothetical protein